MRARGFTTHVLIRKPFSSSPNCSFFQLVFDGLKKKKKKSKPKTEETVEEGLAATTSSPVSTPSASAAADDASEDINSMFADLKKKKKKKKPDLADFEAKMKAEEEGEGEEEQGDGAAANDDNDAAGGSLEEEGGDGDDDGIFQRDGDDMDASSESTQLKASGSSSSSGAETWLGTNRDYTYQEVRAYIHMCALPKSCSIYDCFEWMSMGVVDGWSTHHDSPCLLSPFSLSRSFLFQLLSRFFRILRQNNPELVGEKKKYTIVPPSVHREGAKKTVFANIADICKRMRRPPEHCIQYLFAELGTTGSVDGSQRLMIKGRFQQKQIENVLKKYIGKER